MQIIFNSTKVKQSKGSKDMSSLNVSLTESSESFTKAVESTKPASIDTTTLTEEETKTVNDFIALVQAKSQA